MISERLGRAASFGVLTLQPLRRALSGPQAPLRRRHLLFPAILIAEAALLLLFVTRREPVAQESPRGAALSIVDIAGPPEEAPQEPTPEQAEVVRPEPLVELTPQIPPIEAAAIDEPAAAPAAGTACDLAETLRRTVQDDPLLGASVDSIAPEARSVANAVMLWDGAWVDVEEASSQAAILTLRSALMERIRTAPPECVMEEVTGPRFITFAGAADTTMLVLGSGTWRWAQLLSMASKPADEAAPPDMTFSALP
jgi:hypothetical protein